MTRPSSRRRRRHGRMDNTCSPLYFSLPPTAFYRPSTAFYRPSTAFYCHSSGIRRTFHYLSTAFRRPSTVFQHVFITGGHAA